MPLTIVDKNDPPASTSRMKPKEALSQAFCLRWDSFQNNMLNVFEKLFQDEQFVDVTLACDGQLIKAHKMVLSASSPYFQEIFVTNPCQHPVLIMKDIPLDDLQLIIEFMYKGEINVNKNQIAPLLKVAEALKIRGLADGSDTSDANETTESHEPVPSTSKAEKTVVNKTNQPKQSKRSSRKASNDSVELVEENSSVQATKKRKKSIEQEPIATSTRTSVTEDETIVDFDDDIDSDNEDDFAIESVRSVKNEKDLLDYSAITDNRVSFEFIAVAKG